MDQGIGIERTTRQASPQVLWIFISVTVFSLAGTRLAAIAVPWYVLTTTGSPALTGVVAFAELAPYVVVKALSGPLIDRIGPIPVSVVSGTLSVLGIAAIPALHGTGMLSYPMLVALVVFIGILRAPGDGAKATLVPVVAVASGASLEKVSGAYGAVDRLAATLGAALGGLVIAAVGGATALWLTVGAFTLDVLVAGLLLGPRVACVDLRSGAPEGCTSYFGRLREGWRFLRGDSVLVAIIAVLAVTNMLEQAFGVALAPMWALQTGGGPAALGFLFAVASASSVLGAIVAAGLGERLPRRTVYIGAYLLVGLPRFAVLAIGAPLPVTLTVLAIGGFAAGFINPILGAVIVERIPGHLMGRVNTLAMACAWALLPVGGLVGGLLVTGLGLGPALWTVGIAYVLVTMSPTLMPAWRLIDRRRRTLTPAGPPCAAADGLPESSRVQGSTPRQPARSPQP